MDERYACRFDVRGEGNGAASAVAVEALVRDWVAGILGEEVDLAADGQLGHKGSPAARWIRLHHPVQHRHGLRVELTQPLVGVVRGASPEGTLGTPPTVVEARTTVEVAGERQKARVIVRGGLQSASRGLRPLAAAYPAPTIVRRIVEAVPASIGRWGLFEAGSVRQVTAADVPLLCQDLTDPDREVPIVCASADLTAGVPAIDGDRLAAELTALAEVRVLIDDTACRALSAAVGDYRSVYGGAVRIYWPGFSAHEPPREHRYWTREALTAAGTDLAVELRDLLSRIVLAGLPPEPWSTQPVTDPTQPDEVSGLLNRYQQDNKVLRARLAKLERTLPSGGPSSMADAVKRAAADYGHDIVFLPEALTSAGESSYHSPSRIYDALSALAEAARRYRDHTLPGGFHAFFATRGFDYASGVSPTALGRWRRDYERTYRGQIVLLSPHLKFGTGPPQSCARVYWYLDTAERRVVVGHVGKHLKDTNS
ncbi:MAG: hypothetical protein ACRDZ4_19665 [Egibacteraceae bacterium]